MTMKKPCAVLVITAAATSVVASSSSSSLSSLSSSPRGVSRRRSHPPINRVLEDADGNGYQYMDDVSAYSIQYGKCVRVKIPQDNDDDEVEGNAYFYNGRYHAQYGRYASFYLCNNYDDGTGCTCDYSIEYATDISTYLETTTEYLDEYCGTCTNVCDGGDGNGRRQKQRQRRVEEEEEEEEDYMDVNCERCTNDCASYNSGDDEAYVEDVDYINCEEAYVDEDGIQYYYAPQCGDDGELVVGVFYDDECTVKTKHDSPEFSYGKFTATTQVCIDCSLDEGDACNTLYGESYHCQSGTDLTNKADEQDDDNQADAPVCSTYKMASAHLDRQYKPRKSENKGVLVFVSALLVLGMSGGFLFMSYAYYVRHIHKINNPDLTGTLSAQDHHATSGTYAASESEFDPPNTATLT